MGIEFETPLDDYENKKGVKLFIIYLIYNFDKQMKN